MRCGGRLEDRAVERARLGLSPRQCAVHASQPATREPCAVAERGVVRHGRLLSHGGHGAYLDNQAGVVRSVNFADRWNGRRWSPVGGGGEISISCPTATICLAAGNGLVTRWAGRHWTRLHVPAQEPWAIACSAPDACTAVGNTLSPPSSQASTLPQPLVERWNGQRWSNQTRLPAWGRSPAGWTASRTRRPRAASPLATREPHLEAPATVPLAETWNGASWAAQRPPLPPDASSGQLRGVDCASPTSCIAVGFLSNAAGTFPLAEHWDGSTWSPMSMPSSTTSPDQLVGIDCLSPDACIAVGGNPGRGRFVTTGPGPLAGGVERGRLVAPTDPGPRVNRRRQLGPDQRLLRHRDRVPRHRRLRGSQPPGRPHRRAADRTLGRQRLVANANAIADQHPHRHLIHNTNIMHNRRHRQQQPPDRRALGRRQLDDPDHRAKPLAFPKCGRVRVRRCLHGGGRRPPPERREIRARRSPKRGTAQPGAPSRHQARRTHSSKRSGARPPRHAPPSATSTTAPTEQRFSRSSSAPRDPPRLRPVSADRCADLDVADRSLPHRHHPQADAERARSLRPILGSPATAAVQAYTAALQRR